jgi:precorrin-6x reductase
MGIKGKHLIGMSGPFSRMMNYVMLKDFDIRYLVTKDAEISNGFIEKMEAAFDLGVKIIVVAGSCSEEEGQEEEIVKRLRDRS